MGKSIKRVSSKRKRGSKKKLSVCQRRLQNKIKINLEEYKQGRWKSRAQAIAVSYSQVKKMYPRCKFNKKSKR